MAKLVKLSEAAEGATLYEECDFGIGTVAVEVVKKQGRGAVLHEDGEEPYYVQYGEKTLRYWDSEPTEQERYAAAWVYGKGGEMG